MNRWSGSKWRKKAPINSPMDPDPESRRRTEAIKCARHFQKIGQSQITGQTKKVDFQRMSLPEIEEWIRMVTEALGINQFNK